MVATGDWNPHSFFYPSLLVDVEAVIVWIQHAVGGLPLATEQTWLFPTEALPAQFPAFLAGRIVVAICGLLTIVVTFAIGQRLGGRLVGICAALVLALAPLHVQNSRFLTTDVPVTLCCALAIWASARASDEPSRWRWWIVAAALVGLATSTKWNGIAVGLVPAALFIATRPRPLTLRSVVGSPVPWLMAAAAGIALVVTTPAVVLSAAEVLDWWRLQAILYANPRQPPKVPGWLFQVRELTIGIADNVPLLGLVVPLGVVGLVAARHRVAWAMLAFAGVYLVILAIPATRYARNVLPVLPVVAVGVGLAVARVVAIATDLRARAGPRQPGSRTRARLADVAIGAMALGAITLLAIDLAAAERQARTDTRTIARNWVLANVPPKAILAREDYSPQFGPDDYRTRNRSPLSQRSLDWYRDLDVNYLIVTSANTDRFLDNPATPAQDSFYRSVFALPEVFRVEAEPDRPGVTIHVFRLRPIAGGP
jgi:hypothetical protein